MAGLIEIAMRFHVEGRLADAERAYNTVLRQDPNQFDALNLLGVLKLQQGDANAAHALISKAVGAKPRSVAALCNLSAVLLALDRSAEALSACDRVLAIDPTDAEAHYNRGAALLNLKRPDEAVASFDRVLAVTPGHVNALFNRANALAALGQFDAAHATLDKLIALAPRHAAALNNHGSALVKLGRPAEALASYDAALAVEPDDAAVLRNRGNALVKLGRFEDALASLDQALSFAPEPAATVAVRAEALRGLGRNSDAIACYHQILNLQPDDYDALVNCSDIQLKLGHPAEALAGYDQAIGFRPNGAEAISRRGFALLQLSRPAEAIEAFRRALGVDTNSTEALGGLAATALEVCHWTQVDELTTRLLDGVTAGQGPISPVLMLGYSDDPAVLLQCSRHLVSRQVPQPPPPLRRIPVIKRDRIRVAYVSGDFRAHATAYQLADLIERHDRSRFELIGISLIRDASEIHARLARAFDRFFDLPAAGDREIAQLLSDQEADIAVDLMGYAIHSRMRMFAYRPAPIQVNYLAYSGTTGADFIDYVIGDSVVLPFDQQPFYTEKIVQLPDTFRVGGSDRWATLPSPTRGEAGLPEQSIVFSSFGHPSKISPEIFEVWMKLLGAVEGSVLWLAAQHPVTHDNLRREAAARGVDPERLIMAPRLPRIEDHLARQRLADIFLDTVPCNAHAAVAEALWAAVPVVTCLGRVLAGRTSAGLLESAGVPELATQSLTDYEALALWLAADPAALAAVRTQLDHNRSSRGPVFDTNRLRRHIEAAYATMWEIWQRGEQPCSFAVPAL